MFSCSIVVIDGREAIVSSSFFASSSVLPGINCKIKPPALITLPSVSTSTPSAIALGTCSDIA